MKARVTGKWKEYAPLTFLHVSIPLSVRGLELFSCGIGCCHSLLLVCRTLQNTVGGLGQLLLNLYSLYCSIYILTLIRSS